MTNSKVEERLNQAGYVLPAAPAPQGSYVPVVVAGSVAYCSGVLPMLDGALVAKGRLGVDITVDEARKGAELAALGILANLKAAIGDLDKVARVARLGGFVASSPDFTDQPEVINAASDLMVLAFGEDGRHSRAAVGVAVLPRGVAVELEATFILK
ncbi:MAG: RidA family protein [Actinomycetota bacterium]|nr:RidA family protein [Actinomycetota bacterium]